MWPRKAFLLLFHPTHQLLRLSLTDVVEGTTRSPIPWPSAPGYRTTQPPCFSHITLFPGFWPVELKEGDGFGPEMVFSFSLAEIQDPELIWEHSRTRQEDP